MMMADYHERCMQRALEEDGEKLRQLTGEEHGPWEFVEIDCPSCQGEGRIIRLASPSRMNTDPEVDHGPCSECNGRGTIWVETMPVTMDDLDPA